MAINTTLVANTIQPRYSKKLLEKAVPLTRLKETATLEDLPANSGATSVRFFRPPQPDLTATGAPAKLTEGVAPTNFREIAYTPIDVTLEQRGQVAKVTDIANNVGLLKYLDTAIDLMSEEFTLDGDTLLRNLLCRGAWDAGALNLAAAPLRRYAQGLANFAGVAGATAANARFTPRDLLDGCSSLKLSRAPTFGGKYLAHLPTQLIRDLLEDADFRDMVKQTHANRVFNGEVGEYYGCRVVENTNPFQEDETEGTFASTFNAGGTNTTGLIYSAIITGKGAYGSVNMKTAGSSPHKPQIIIVDKPDSGNPLNQFIIAGWKSYDCGVILNRNWARVVRAKSRFVE